MRPSQEKRTFSQVKLIPGVPHHSPNSAAFLAAIELMAMIVHCGLIVMLMGNKEASAINTLS